MQQQQQQQQQQQWLRGAAQVCVASI